MGGRASLRRTEPLATLANTHLCFSSCCLTSTVSGGVRSSMARTSRGVWLPAADLTRVCRTVGVENWRQATGSGRQKWLKKQNAEHAVAFARRRGAVDRLTKMMNTATLILVLWASTPRSCNAILKALSNSLLFTKQVADGRWVGTQG